MTASVDWPDAFGYLGALLLLGTYSMKTMIPLRIFGLCANRAFIVYGYFAPAYPQLLLHVCLLPLNGMRLYQMLQLVDKVKTATRGNLDMEWLKPFMTKRACQAGEKIFSKGDVAAVMYYTWRAATGLPSSIRSSVPARSSASSVSSLQRTNAHRRLNASRPESC